MEEIHQRARRRTALAVAALLFLAGPAPALGERPHTRTVHFEGGSLADALARVGAVFNIEITVGAEIDRPARKGSYVNQPADRIIQDLFRHENVAITWGYRDGRLRTVDIRLAGTAGPGRSIPMQNGGAVAKAGRRTAPRAPEKHRHLTPPPLPSSGFSP